MDATYSVYKLDSGGYGYQVQGENFNLRQDFAPGKPGFQSMSEAEATAFAQAQVAELAG